MECQVQLPIMRVEKRFFLLNRTDKDTWGLVSSVTVEDGVLVVTLRSILQVDLSRFIYLNIVTDIHIYFLGSKSL